jgi:hypothetical protein
MKKKEQRMLHLFIYHLILKDAVINPTNDTLLKMLKP